MTFRPHINVSCLKVILWPFQRGRMSTVVALFFSGRVGDEMKHKVGGISVSTAMFV